jgi:hypothetical protein
VEGLIGVRQQLEIVDEPGSTQRSGAEHDQLALCRKT